MKIIIAFVVLFISTVSVFADSPLTSTPFNTAYEGSSKVQEALNCNGVISEDLMKFLNSKNNSIALKVAVINAIGWNLEGQGNYVRYNDFLGNKKGKGALKAQNLLCLAYLKAMDNYFDCNDALRIADEALALNPKSYTFNIIHALIKAQVLFDVSWCELWNETDIVRKNNNLTMDMNAEAIRIIFEYMDLYKEECD
ncbi:MAG TPA: hypothetical protein PLA88_00350 [Bacteroidales bacterium]|nr:hypothetical protein [Bacteroidales bacterium]